MNINPKGQYLCPDFFDTLPLTIIPYPSSKKCPYELFLFIPLHFVTNLLRRNIAIFFRGKDIFSEEKVVAH